MNLHENPEQLSAYIDGGLNDAERALVEDHLPGCAECRGIVEALRATVIELRALDEPVPSRSAELRGAIARARGRGARAGRWSAAIAGAAAVVAGIVAISVNGGGGRVALDAGGGGAQFSMSESNSIVSVESTDYTEASAAALLGPTQYQALEKDAPVAAPKEAQADTSARTSAPDYAAAIARCDDEAFGEVAPRPAMQRAIVATFKKTPAFLLVYDVPDGSTTRTELWVFRRSDCFVLYFKPGQ